MFVHRHGLLKAGFAWVAISLCGFSVEASTLVQYQFTNSNSGAPTYDPGFLAPDVLLSHLSADSVNNQGTGNVAGDPASPASGMQGGGATFADTLFINSGSASVGYFTDPASAVAGKNYFQFTVSPDSEHAINLSGLSFDAANGGSSGPRGWVLRTSVDNYLADVDAQTVSTVRPITTHYDISLTGLIFQELSSPTTLRIYTYAPAGTNIGVFYDNLTLSGTVVTPLPAAVWLFASALGGLGFFGCRKKAKD